MVGGGVRWWQWGGGMMWWQWSGRGEVVAVVGEG